MLWKVVADLHSVLYLTAAPRAYTITRRQGFYNEYMTEVNETQTFKNVKMMLPRLERQDTRLLEKFSIALVLWK